MKNKPWENAPTDFAEAVIRHAHRKPRAEKLKISLPMAHNIKKRLAEIAISGGAA